jgi:glycosyltransferase involved in cell wall biosynthesis
VLALNTRVNRSVVVVTNIPRPYRRALFGVLRERLARDGYSLRVLYTSDPSKHARRGASSAVSGDPAVESYVPSLNFRVSYEKVVTIPTGLRRMLEHDRPSCVVAGGFGPDALMCAHWCRATNTPYVLWSGGWPGRESKPNSLRVFTRKRLTSKANAFIAYGTAAAEHLVVLGAQPERVFCAWNTVDLETIASAARAAAARRAELATKYRLAARNLLFVGSMVERKGVRELVAAAVAAQPRDPDWALHLVGPGPLRPELERTVRRAGREGHFRFHGMRSKEDVAELLGLADGFLLPTKQEPWGLVINEAMACGIPVVASPWAGATRDLIENEVSGYVVEPTDIGALAEIMVRLLSGDDRCRQVGLAGAEAVRAKASLEKSADGFVSAVRCATPGYSDESR